MCDPSWYAGNLDRHLLGAVLVLSLTRLATPVPAAGADTELALRGDPTRGGSEAAPFDVQVEVEEIVCELSAYDVTNNGSGMFWSSGSAQMVRVGDRLFVSAFEAVPGAAPLNNARWALYERLPEGWRFCQRDEKDRTREPCSLATSHAGRLLMSVNPTLAPLVPAPAKAA